MNFGEKLKKLRNKYGLSQQELADKLGMGNSTIAQYELSQREPNFAKLKLFKDFFNVDYNFLLEDQEDDKEKIDQLEPEELDLIVELKKNKIIVNGNEMDKEAVKGLIMFLENFK